MTKLFLKHLAKQVGFVASLFGVMFASSWIANQLFNEPLFGLVGLLVAFMVFWNQALGPQQRERHDEKTNL